MLNSAISAISRIRLALTGPGGRLAELRSRVPGRIIFLTNFGIEDQLITHFILSRDLAIDVVTFDTGRLLPSTYEVWNQTEQKYGRRVRSVHADAAAGAEIVAEAGINGFYHSKDERLACCQVRKVEPLERALAGAEAWVTGLRADQSGQRSTVALESWDEERLLIKFAPLFDWTRAEVAEFCAAEQVPVSAVQDEGFSLFGCQPCTGATALGEPDRAGRWWWEEQGNAECGLHSGPNGKLTRGKST